MPTEPSDRLGDLRRLGDLEAFDVLDTPPNADFDRLTRLAARLLDAPVALVSLVTGDRQFFKSCLGLPEPWASERETPLSHSFCQHVVNDAKPLIIDDAREHPLVRDNLAISELGVVAYLGIPLVSEAGHVLGSFCVIDTQSRSWTAEEIETLRELAASVMTELKLNRRIADEERLKREMQGQRDGLRVMLRSIGDAVIATDAEGCISFMNPVAESLTRCAEEDVKGLRIDSVFRIVNEASRIPVEQPVMNVIEEGVIKGLANHTVLIARDGAEYPISDSAAPIRGADGELTGVILVFRDVTAERKIAADLAENEERFRTLADSISQLVWEAKPDGHIYWYNSRWYEYTGTTPEAMDGWGWRSVHDPDVLPGVLARWKASLECGEPFDMVFPLRGADGVFRPFLTRVVPQRDRDGRIARWCGTNTDISEQVRMEELLRENDRHRNEFLAMLAHELRNPLAAISNAGKLAHATRDEEQLAFTCEVINRQVATLGRLIDDLLDVSRVSQGKVTLRKTTLELGRILEGATELAQAAIDRRCHTFLVEVAEPALRFEGDRTRVEQILGNILTNAAKYTKPGGRIVLSARGDGRDVIFSVKDNGIGIPKEMLPKVFDLFTQVDSAIDRSHGGLGIGLTLVRDLVEMHGGRVSAASDGEGRGSTFTVRLPLGNPTVEEAKPEVKAAMRRRSRILVVDDNQDVAKLTTRLLANFGHEVKTAFDGHQALEWAQSFRPEVVLLDIGLPGMNGYEVATALRGHESCRDTTYIAVTGYGEDAAIAKASEAGFHHHLTKPIDFDELTRLIEARERA